MRRSELFIKTRKDAPADETARNAQLLIRAGYIHKEMAGVYSYLPLGKRVLDNIAQIVREEMDAIGGQEVLLSTLQNKEIWLASGRWDDKVVDSWFKTKLVSGTEVGIGLTHEEPLINVLKSYVNSYKDLPLYIYQIQNKFRNELRAKSGLLRGREFLMKDLYSFSRSQAEHAKFYEQVIEEAYYKIYERLGIGDITYKTLASGGIFSKLSHEFQTLSRVGEDTIYIDKTKKIAINQEIYSDALLKEQGLKKTELVEEKAVEVGNIFPLGTKYTDALGLYFTDEGGQRQSIIMGCYGIGISRLMGLLAEHFAGERGLAWPAAIAPFQVYLVRLGDEAAVTEAADSLYAQLTGQAIGVLYDDRGASAGEQFADADLLGLPWRVVVSAQTIAADQFELKARGSDKPQLVNLDHLLKALAKVS